MSKTLTLGQSTAYVCIEASLKIWVLEYTKSFEGRVGRMNPKTVAQPEEMAKIAQTILEYIQEFQDEDFDHMSGGYFMDGLRTAHPDLYRFSVGYFGGHDFVWKLK